MLESKEGGTVYNPRRVMRQFDYDQGAVILSDNHSTSSDVAAKERFTGHDISHILASKKKIYWPGIRHEGFLQ